MPDLTGNALLSCRDRIALVTGGGSGIGRMIAEGLASNGAKVYITGRRQETLETACNEFKRTKKEGFGDLIPLQGDISSKEKVNKLVGDYKQKESRLDFLVNSAGVHCGTFSPDVKDPEAVTQGMLDLKWEDWTMMYDINVVGLVYTTFAFAPLLQREKGQVQSAVLNISSIAGQHHLRAAVAGYQSSKAAVLHLTPVLASKLFPHYIRLNCISPGLFPSQMTKEDPEELRKSHRPFFELIPADRAGRTEDMAAAAVMLLTNEYINGVNLTVDGGRVLCVSGAEGGKPY